MFSWFVRPFPCLPLFFRSLFRFSASGAMFTQHFRLFMSQVPSFPSDRAVGFPTTSPKCFFPFFLPDCILAPNLIDLSQPRSWGNPLTVSSFIPGCLDLTAETGVPPHCSRTLPTPYVLVSFSRRRDGFHSVRFSLRFTWCMFGHPTSS